MRSRDAFSLAVGALREHKLRTGLSMLGIAIGIAAVILVTSLGEGTRLFLVGQFTQFGTNLLQINPGRTETGGLPGVLGGTTRKLTIRDAEALRRIPGVEEVVSITVAQARVEARGRGRSVYVYGVTSGAPGLWKMSVRQGRFIQPGDPERAADEVVLGDKLAREIFGEESAIGQRVRVGGARLRVVGVMAEKGEMLGFDMDDIAFVPVAAAMRLFNVDELMEIDVTYANASMGPRIVQEIERILTERHAGHRDFTVTTQAQMLSVLDSVMNAVTLAVAAIGAVSLLVGAVGILTMMWIAVGERTFEIGLVRALGARAGDVQRIFLIEATALSCLGGLAGVVAGLGGGRLLALLVPGLPVHTSPGFLALAIGVSLLTGLAAGALPARRAALLDPVEALRAE